MNTQLLRDGVAYADLWLAHQRAQREVPGTVLAIEHDSEIMLSKGYGWANIEQQAQMTPRHIFRIASHSKTFTATAVMLLVERSQLRLDDRASHYLDWLDAPVTIRQLLNHVGGITRDGLESDFWQLERKFPDVAELQRIAHGVLEPNTQFKYSNIGFGLLGQVIERASGQPYNAFVKAEIVDRLRLVDTGPETHPGMTNRLVTGYTPYRPGLPRLPIADTDTRALSSATGFYSTAEDLCRFGRAHYFGNAELLTDASKREMQQPYWTVPEADQSYGLGFAVHTIGKGRMIGHGGGFPGHSTTTLIDPDARLVVVVLNNTHGTVGLASPLAVGIVKILDFALSSGDEPRHWSPERYAGRFMNLGGITDIACFGSKILAFNPDEADPTAHATELEVVDADTLRIARTSGYGSPGETVRYERTPDGAISALRFGGARCLPSTVYETYFRGLSQVAVTP